jgi:hypothetical protein
MIGDGDGHAEAVNGHDYTVLYTVVMTLYHLTVCTQTTQYVSLNGIEQLSKR